MKNVEECPPPVITIDCSDRVYMKFDVQSPDARDVLQQRGKNDSRRNGDVVSFGVAGAEFGHACDVSKVTGRHKAGCNIFS